VPAFIIPAPASPPISACELLEEDAQSPGQQIPADRAHEGAEETVTSMTSAATIPVPMVCATCRPKNRNAMKLENAAHATAYCGGSTRVDTTVAMELAAS
jgi:hypothetical protein